MQNIETIKASKLAEKIEGVLYGPDVELHGNYTFLNKASKNDIVIRHWINDKGIEIAKNKEIACIITQDPHEDAIHKAENMDFPLIVTDHIEYATAHALNVAVKSYANDAYKVAITGTNGKSTTTHLLYTIFSDLGYDTYTNTDAESEGNTLIDPRVASEITDFYNEYNNIDVIVLEVSEVQGWLDRLMENHAYQMISSLSADSSIITNAALDHIGLVKSFEDIKYEISGAARSLNDQNKESLLVLNYEDENIKAMKSCITKDNVTVKFFGKYDETNLLDISYKENEGIYCKNKLYIKEEDLPFNSWHFIQDIMAAICVCEHKKLNHEKVIKSLKNYVPLARRFIKLKENPVIIDDFAHNPSGVQLTIENGSKQGTNHLFIVNAIRGSRGEKLNGEISKALVESLKNRDDYTLILTCSKDVVDHLNTVTDTERKIFTDVLNENNIQFVVMDNLEDALLKTIDEAVPEDVILLLGAQGMDPASSILSKHNII